jgi:hypothetical protein
VHESLTRRRGVTHKVDICQCADSNICCGLGRGSVSGDLRHAGQHAKNSCLVRGARVFNLRRCEFVRARTQEGGEAHLDLEWLTLKCPFVLDRSVCVAESKQAREIRRVEHRGKVSLDSMLGTRRSDVVELLRQASSAASQSTCTKHPHHGGMQENAECGVGGDGLDLGDFAELADEFEGLGDGDCACCDPSAGGEVTKSAACALDANHGDCNVMLGRALSGEFVDGGCLLRCAVFQRADANVGNAVCADDHLQREQP